MNSKALLCMALACLAVLPALNARAIGEHHGCGGASSGQQDLLPPSQRSWTAEAPTDSTSGSLCMFA